jgi:hypothetical protein
MALIDPRELNETYTTQLSVALFNDLRAFYHRTETDRARVFEALKSLAFVVAKILAAIDDPAEHEAVRQWFNDCVDRQEEEIDAAQEQSHEEQSTTDVRSDRRRRQ